MNTAALDHLVVAAPTLDEGVRWCESTLGVTPGLGGEHPLFGTHNRLWAIGSASHPDCYLEIIAIQPDRVPQRPAPLRRWFDLDDEGVQKALRDGGPRLLHWVVRVPDLAEACRRWQALGLDAGPCLGASRMTPQGLLQWQIAVRDDGQRLLHGALPTLIQWGDRHPTHTMAHSDLSLTGWRLQHPEPGRVTQALAAIGLDRVEVTPGPVGGQATLSRIDGPDVELIGF